MSTWIRPWVLAAAMALAGCGGGGSDNSTGSGPGQAPVGGADPTGTLKLLFGDGPVDDFDQVLLSISGIRLIGEDGSQEVVDLDPATIDLLQLRNVTELVVDARVAAGVYSKIRLLVESLELVRLDDQGQVVERIDVRVPANGHIDLNAQQDFEIAADEDLVVEVDVDLHRAIHVVQTGNGQYRFRPVVFVNILDGSRDGRLLRLFGTMDMIDAAAGSLLLCDTELVASDDDVPSDDCKTIRLADGALVLDQDGHVATLDTLSGTATVLARFRYGVEADDNYYQAVLLAAGAEDAFERRFGTVTSATADGAFSLLPDAADTEIEVRLLDDDGDSVSEAVIVAADQSLAGPGAIQPGLRAELWGRTRDEGTAEAHFEAFLVYLAQDMDDLLRVSGTVTVLDLAAGELTVDVDGTSRCVQLTSDTEFFGVDEGEGQVDAGAIDPGELREGLEVDVIGEAENDAGCVVATEVVVVS